MPEVMPSFTTPADPTIYQAAGEQFTIRTKDSFEIFAHGVKGISLKVHAPSIDRMELKLKLMQLHDIIMRHL